MLGLTGLGETSKGAIGQLPCKRCHVLSPKRVHFSIICGPAGVPIDWAGLGGLGQGLQASTTP